VPAAFGATGTHIAQTVDRIDPMMGLNEHMVVDTYMGLLGPVCMTMTDNQVYYYDYLTDTADSVAAFADFSGASVHTTTIAQTLTLQNASATPAAKKAANTGTLSPLAMSAARAQFALNAGRKRHALMAQTIKRIEAKIKNGGLK
jgi:hypothetical protein